MKWLVRSLICCVPATAAWAQVVVVYPPAQPSTVVIEREVPIPVAVQPHDVYAPIQETTYLIALKGWEGVVIAKQYWVKGGTLYYVTADHQERTTPIGRIDLTLTFRLNSERNVAFYLPAEQETTVARPRLVRRAAAKTVHKRCYCKVPSSARASSPVASGASRAAPATR